MLEPQAPQHDQLGFFVFLAFALHMMLVLGISFTHDAGEAIPPQLEVTLAQFRSESAPEDARFVAQANQEGSGTLAERAELTTRRQAEFNDNRIRELGGAPVPTRQQQRRQDRIATTIADAVNEVLVETLEEEPEPLTSAAIDPDIRSLNESIASLEARLDQQQQAYAERPRVKRLTSLSARAAEDAAYLHNWRSKVEAVGNRYYPTASSRYGIYGDLRLLVAIRYDGQIDNIEVLSSSGHAVLDEAAIRIVRLAAPFEPFPASLRETTDRLEIIRTWKFRKNRLSSERG
ncbi:MAG: TonB family protein [Halieaceae bacterium]|jgi:protein TonB|nr:TonB family protein [Halieaceae bacterium]